MDVVCGAALAQQLQRLATVFILAATGLACGYARADCLPSTREVKFADGSARVKNYVCSLPGAAKPQLQVEFNSLSEAAAGSLVEDTPNPDLARAIGKWRAVRNDVFKEAKALFDAYGTKEVVGSGIMLTHRNVGVPSNIPASSEQTIWYFQRPDAENLTALDLPLPTEEKTILATTHWPNGWRFYYVGLDVNTAEQCKEAGVIGCTLLWRPAQPSDVADYIANRRAVEAQRLLEDPIRGMTAKEKAQLDAELRAGDEKLMRYIGLVQHLNAGGWKSDFLTVTGQADACGDGFEFRLHIRQMRLETAFVTNISSEQLSVGGLIGDVEPGTSLRVSAPPAPGAAAEPLLGQAITLAPGDKIAVPLRILFVPAGGRDAVFQTDYLSGVHPIDLAAAGRVYQVIQSAKPGTIFMTKHAIDVPNPIKKTRESFGPPSAPAADDFTWGPAINLRGVTLNGRRIDFDRGAPNSFMITIAGEYGSCPYLYAFDAGANAWVRHGKIIDNANSATKEMTQRVEFVGLVDRFSIREEELEVSYIRSVRLEARLHDGRDIELTPREQEGSTAATSLAVIRSGEAHDYAFVLPEGVAATDIAHSTFIVRGYYQRYSSIPIAER